MQSEEDNENVPNFIDLLSAQDRSKYEEMQADLAAPSHRYNRHKRISTFTEMLETIKQFCLRGDDDDWKRCLVCGIAWLGNDIAINTRQLRIVLGKSKSSINGALAKMGFETLPSKDQDSTALQEIIPFLKGNFAENRQWTVRKKNDLKSTFIDDKPKSPPPVAPAETTITVPSKSEDNHHAADSLSTLSIPVPELFPTISDDTRYDFQPEELPQLFQDSFVADFKEIQEYDNSIEVKIFDDDQPYSYYGDLRF